jgi:two-component system chemotaxis response regulator CheB
MRAWLGGRKPESDGGAMEHQFLLPGDSATARSPTHLATLLGSCVSVCLSNSFQHVAGMNHYMLPEAITGGDVGHYGDTSILNLAQTMFALDADPRHYRARVYGGGSVTGHLGALGDIGARNIEVARRVLGELCIDIQHEEVGGNRGRRIDFDTRTDVIRCRLLGREGPWTRDVQARILVVDDSCIVRRLIRAGLSSCEGIEVVGEASDAFEARELVLSLDPDVLTLDIELPPIDGVTFLRQLMKHLPKPVIVMSSMATVGSEFEARARAAGAFEVIDKACLQPTKGLDGVRSVLAPILRRAASSRVAMKMVQTTLGCRWR